MILLFGLNLFGQNFTVKEFTTNNGLISAANKKTIQAANNFYYICSFGGLVRFDGTSFKSFTNANGLYNYRVNDLFEQKPGQFLVCNYFNLFRFDGAKFTNINTKLPATTEFQKTVKLSNGNVLILSSLGAFQILENDVITPFYLEKNIKINNLLEYKPLNYVYFNLATNSIRKIDQFTNKTINIQIPYQTEFQGFTSYKNEPLVITNKGLFSILGGSFTLFQPKNFNENSKIKLVFVDSKNREWFCDLDNNILLFNGKKIINISKKYQLKNQNTLEIIEDKNGNIIITNEQSIIILKEQNTIEIELENETSYGYFLAKYSIDTVFVGLEKNGLLLVSKGKRILKPVDTRILNFEVPIKNGRFFRSAKYPEGVIHLFRKGFYKIINGKLTLFNSQKMDTNSLLRGYYDADNEYFMAGGNGKLYIIKSKNIDTLSFEKFAKGLGPHSFAKANNGAVLFVASHKKLLKYDVGKIADITDQLKLDGKDFDIIIHQNTLWVIVLGIEIRQYSFENTGLKLIRKIVKNDGLLDANIGRFQIDNLNNLWLNCFSGLYFLRFDNQNKIFSKKIPFAINNNETVQIENILYADGQILATGKNKIYINPTKNKQLNIKPIASYFSSIKVNNSEIIPNNNISNNSKFKTFPADSNNFSFTANTIYYGFDDAIQYQYKLDEADAEWKTLMQGNIINYNNLPSGNYVFRLRSINNFNESFYTETKYEFEIRPPYYKTGWFRSIMAILAITSIYFFIRQRDIQKHQKNQTALQVSNLKLTALQSQMNPHFIFNSLNSIQNYILQQKPLDAAKYLSKFSKLMRRILDQSFNNLQPLSEIVETLKMYLELEAFRFKNEFNYEIKIDDEDKIADVKLPPLLLQPYVENAIIHGLMPKEGDKKLTIHLYLAKNELHCVVDDNGVGRGNKLFDQSGDISRGQKLTADMLVTMKTLINADAKIEIIDKVNKNNKPLGTKVDLIIPIKAK